MISLKVVNRVLEVPLGLLLSFAGDEDVRAFNDSQD
jgi:hypothetical protein